MNDTKAKPRFFAVTTPGLTATRWLTYVLASHPDVFVAHGKFALDSVSNGDFHKEQETASIDSLTRGNETRTFYEDHSLAEVHAAYQTIKPAAHAFGSVHSYTMHTLVQAAREPAALADLRIVNVVRHPVNLIASHYSLVRSAENHPPLYRTYVDEILPAVLQQFPELFLIGCPDYRAFLAFAVSCMMVNNLILDLCYPSVRHIKMEELTTQIPMLRDFCEGLTGLPYAPAALEEFVRKGPINRHRATNASTCPRSIYVGWARWQQDMVHTILSGVVLDWLEELGYDLSMLREPAKPVAANTNLLVPCLADCLRAMDARHPHLAYMTPAAPNRVQAAEVDYQGFNLQQTHDKVYAVACSLGLADVSLLDEAKRLQLQEDGTCLCGESLAEVWLAIATVLASRPVLCGEHRGFNLLSFRDKWYGVLQGTAIHLEQSSSKDRQKWIAQGRLMVGLTADVVKQCVDEKLHAVEMLQPPKLVGEYRGYNLIAYQANCYAAIQGMALCLENVQSDERRELMIEKRLIVEPTREAVQRRIDEILHANDTLSLSRWLDAARMGTARIKRMFADRLAFKSRNED